MCVCARARACVRLCEVYVFSMRVCVCECEVYVFSMRVCVCVCVGVPREREREREREVWCVSMCLVSWCMCVCGWVYTGSGLQGNDEIIRFM